MRVPYGGQLEITMQDNSIILRVYFHHYVVCLFYVYIYLYPCFCVCNALLLYVTDNVNFVKSLSYCIIYDIATTILLIFNLYM